MNRKPVPMMSLRDAAARGIERVYQPNWVGRMDHFKIDIIDGRMGPWVHLYSPQNKEINGRDPVDMLALAGVIDVNAKGCYAYTGPLPDSDEYKAEAEKFAAMCRATQGKGVAP
jgi:hypothetical protein